MINILRVLTSDICNILWHRLLLDKLQLSKELFVNSCFDQAVCGAKAAPTPPDVGDEYSTYRQTLWVIDPQTNIIVIIEQKM